MKINTKFNIDQRIYIKELKIWGTVVSILYTNKIEYYIRYFNNYQPTTVYFLESDLSNNETDEQIGFKK